MNNETYEIQSCCSFAVAFRWSDVRSAIGRHRSAGRKPVPAGVGNAASIGNWAYGGAEKRDDGRNPQGRGPVRQAPATPAKGSGNSGRAPEKGRGGRGAGPSSVRQAFEPGRRN